MLDQLSVLAAVSIVTHSKEKKAYYRAAWGSYCYER
jgi:hypothetical protein